MSALERHQIIIFKISYPVGSFIWNDTLDACKVQKTTQSDKLRTWTQYDKPFKRYKVVENSPRRFEVEKEFENDRNVSVRGEKSTNVIRNSH